MGPLSTVDPSPGIEARVCFVLTINATWPQSPSQLSFVLWGCNVGAESGEAVFCFLLPCDAWFSSLKSYLNFWPAHFIWYFLIPHSNTHTLSKGSKPGVLFVCCMHFQNNSQCLLKGKRRWPYVSQVLTDHFLYLWKRQATGWRWREGEMRAFFFPSLL